MGFKCGIVGLPNVGKSTLFNALTRTAAAQAANYPFCTIEPNTGEVAVPDPRMQKLASIAGSKEIIPTRISFVDIAGLVRGASKGEGLGNKFLANIREVDAVVHVLRCFEDDDITHVEGKINPVGDADTIETELMLADLESLERRVEQTRKRAASKDKDSLAQLPVMEAVIKLLNEGKPARLLLKTLAADEIEVLKGLNLLTSHPVLYVCNVAEADALSGLIGALAIAFDEFALRTVLQPADGGDDEPHGASALRLAARTAAGPHLFEVVEGAGLVEEDVGDPVAVVHEDPAQVLAALDAGGADAVGLGDLLLDVLDDGTDQPGVGRAGDHEQLGDAQDLADPEHHGRRPALGVGGSGGGDRRGIGLGRLDHVDGVSHRRPPAPRTGRARRSPR